jgi:thiol-disulfide isomerase/thioredoxin
MIPIFLGPPEPEVGKLAPNVAFVRQSGNPVRLSEFRGKVLVIEFSSFACPPCVELAPKLEKLAKVYRGRIVVFLVVSTDPPENLAKMVALREPSDPTLLLQDVYNRDRSKMAVWQFGNVATPTMFVIDAAGKFASRRIEDGNPHLEQRLEWALKKRSELPTAFGVAKCPSGSSRIL